MSRKEKEEKEEEKERKMRPVGISFDTTNGRKTSFKLWIYNNNNNNNNKVHLCVFVCVSKSPEVRTVSFFFINASVQRNIELMFTSHRWVYYIITHVLSFLIYLYTIYTLSIKVWMNLFLHVYLFHLSKL